MKAERSEGSGRPHVGVQHQETPSGCFVKLFSNWGARCGSEGKKSGGGGGGGGELARGKNHSDQMEPQIVLKELLPQQSHMEQKCC